MMIKGLVCSECDRIYTDKTIPSFDDKFDDMEGVCDCGGELAEAIDVGVRYDEFIEMERKQLEKDKNENRNSSESVE